MERRGAAIPVKLPSDQDASGRTLGREELELLESVIRSGVLISTKGTFVRRLEELLAMRFGVRHAVACSSGTAAIHAAIAALDPEPGDEIVTSPITDMGAITPILYQGAVPVFADVDRRSFTITAKSIERCLSSRTRAIVVTHLFGCPAEMGPILRLADERGVPVIEDSAQAYLAASEGALVGTLGAVGCFSLQQGKHVTTGEGGVVITDDDRLARRIRLFVNKAWDYESSEPDHMFLALNYRMTELQGAVGVAQAAKIDASVERRVATAARLSERLRGVAGLTPPWIPPESVHSFWKYCVRIDSTVVPGGPVALAEALRERGVASAPNYIKKPAFQCRVVREQKTFGASRYPFTLARPEAVDYAPERFPGTFDSLREMLVLPWNERYTAEHVEAIGSVFEDSLAELGVSG